MPTKHLDNSLFKIYPNLHRVFWLLALFTYQTFNSWMNRGKTEKSGKYYLFYKYIQKRNAYAAKVLLERLNKAADAGNCQVCMWVLDRRFSDDFGRRVYRKTNVVSENLNQNVEIKITNADTIRKGLIEKFTRFR